MGVPERHVCGWPSPTIGLLSALARCAQRVSDWLVSSRAADRWAFRSIDHGAGR